MVLVIKDSLRNRLLMVIPWNDGKVSFESVNDDGEIIIQMKRNATFGPFDIFDCGNLWNVNQCRVKKKPHLRNSFMETGIMMIDGHL